MDDYVNGALSDVDTTRFEEHFLSTPRRTLKLSLARALAARTGSTIQELPETVGPHSDERKPDPQFQPFRLQFDGNGTGLLPPVSQSCFWQDL